MNAHEYAAIFPMAGDAEIAEIAEDIKHNGLRQPIITLDGKILDGRNRFAACAKAGIAPRYEKYSGSDPLADVVSWNLHRRHLTQSQKSTIAAEIKPMFEKRARERQIEGGEKKGKANLPEASKGQARDQAAAAVGVSGRTVQDAENVKKEAPDLYDKVKNGEMTVNAAKNEAKRRQPKKAQKRRSPGTYEDWQKLRELARTAKDAAKEMARLQVDAQHRIPARELCESLAGEFNKVARQLPIETRYGARRLWVRGASPRRKASCAIHAEKGAAAH